MENILAGGGTAVIFQKLGGMSALRRHVPGICMGASTPAPRSRVLILLIACNKTQAKRVHSNVIFRKAF